MIGRSLLALAATIVTSFAVALVATVVLAIADLYLTGHGRESLDRAWIERAGGAVSLSRADALLLLVTLLSFVVAFRVFLQVLGRVELRRGLTD